MTRGRAISYGRAKRLGNRALFAIDLQVRRLQSSEREDEVFAFRRWSDFEFLVVALMRLHRAAKLAARASAEEEQRRKLLEAIAAFDATLPGWGRFRNVAEHIDDYALGHGHDKTVEPQQLESSIIDKDGPTLKWLDRELNASVAIQASRLLFSAIQGGGVD